MISADEPRLVGIIWAVEHRESDASRGKRGAVVGIAVGASHGVGF